MHSNDSLPFCEIYQYGLRISLFGVHVYESHNCHMIIHLSILLELEGQNYTIACSVLTTGILTSSTAQQQIMKVKWS
jgi:hypothetical protein